MKQNYSDRYVYQLPKLYKRPFIKGQIYTRQQIIKAGGDDPDSWGGNAWIKIHFNDYLKQIEDYANTNGN